MMCETNAELVLFFKALADETRLKIVGLLARERYSGEQLAALLDVRPATVSHHLAKLAEAGLVEAEASGHAKLYRLRLEVVQAMAARLLQRETLPQAARLDPEAQARKVVRDFTRRDGSLKAIPAQRKKREFILRHVVQVFDPGTRYSESEVNTRLARFHPDTASLRRELISSRLMQRAEGRYWREPA